MTDRQARQRLAELAAQIDRIDSLIIKTEKEIETLMGAYNGLVDLYDKTADQLEELSHDIGDKVMARQALTLSNIVRSSTKNRIQS